MLHYMRMVLVARKSERGATAVEYGLMVALIAVVIIVAVAALGGYLSELFDGVGDKINDAAPTT